MRAQRSKWNHRGVHRSHISGRRYRRRKDLDDMLAKRIKRLARALGLYCVLGIRYSSRTTGGNDRVRRSKGLMASYHTFPPVGPTWVVPLRPGK